MEGGEVRLVPTDGSASRNVATANAVSKLRENIASQEERGRHLEKKIGQLVSEARTKLSKKDRKGALFVLRRKKLLEAELHTLANIKLNLETQVLNIETAAQNAETIKAMNAGKNAMSTIREDANIEEVDDLMEGIKEEIKLVGEASNALAQPLAQPVDTLLTGKDDLVAELQELDTEDSKDQLELFRPAKMAGQPEMCLSVVPSSDMPSTTQFLQIQHSSNPTIGNLVPAQIRKVFLAIMAKPHDSTVVRSLDQEEGEEEEEGNIIIPRDLRERHCHSRGPGRGYFKSMMSLTVFMIVIAVIVFQIKSSNPEKGAGEEREGERMLQTIHASFDPSEALGAKRANVPFKDVDGTPKDPLEIFRDHGYTYARLRVMVGPSGSYGLFQDIDYVKEMARDIVHKNKMKFLLCFHYSHWYANPRHQWIPLDWRAEHGNHVPLAVLKDYVYRHTRSVMEELIFQGTIPDAVQVGNEVNYGMLWETGKIVDGDMQNFVELSNMAIDAMKDSFSAHEVATSSFPQIVMHLGSGGSTEFTEHWFTTFTKAGGQFDIVGLSYSPQWHGSLQDLSNNMKNMKKVFPEKDVWVVETSYYWTETSSDVNELPFDQSEVGQFNYLKSLLEVLVDYGYDTAVFYMGSHWTQGSRWMNSDEIWEDVANRSLFNRNATALKGIDGLVPQC